MPIAVSPKKQFDYVLKRERSLPTEKQTVWKLRTLTVAEEKRITDGMFVQKGKAMGVRSGSTAFDTLKLGLTGWENWPFQADDGSIAQMEQPSERKPVESFFDFLTSADRTELANAITTGGK